MQQIHWTWKDALFLIITFLVVYGLSIPLQFWIADITGEMAIFESAENPQIPESALLINHIAKAFSLTGGIALLLYVFKKQTWEAIGFRPTTRRWMLISVGIGIAQYPIRLLLARVLLTILPASNLGVQNVFYENGYSLAYNLLLFVIITLIVPISEEIFYRGFLFNWMKQNRPLWIAIIFSSLFFAMSHIIPSQIIMVFTLGLVITWVYHKSGSIWTAITIHIVNNALGTLVAILLSNM